MERRTLRLFVAIMISLLSFSIASSKAVLRDGNTFVSQKSSTKKTQEVQKTEFFWEDKEGNKYSIYRTESGACYIIKTSKKTGKEYRQYLPKEVKEEINKEIDMSK